MNGQIDCRFLRYDIGADGRTPAEQRSEATPAPPSPWVERFAPLVPAGGRVLDLACGSGRHCKLFLERGHRVVAVDRDLTQLGALAARLQTVEADLEAEPWPLPGERFAAIVVTNYLWRPLLAALAEALEPGGILIYDTFALGQERFGKPSNPDFLLRPNELLAAFQDAMTVVAYEHGEVADPGPALRQRICARKD
jgi:SAM-dependent methyltransferase